MNVKWKTKFAVIAVIFMALSGLVYIREVRNGKEWLTAIVNETREQADAASESSINNEPEPPLAINESRTIKVHIAGAVASPGVYELPQGSRVNDALESAGGATDTANLHSVNLAAYVTDAQRVVIPDSNPDNNALYGIDISESAVQNNGAELNRDRLININTATANELRTLPGIGEVLAGSIVNYREKNGDFTSIEEIKNVPRIGDGTFSQFMDLITVGRE